ncbi:hypothetical protein HWV62_10661 [Athelia sp. TMB]|nr:hypothetical protein HWV62_10661 [Athelia sp. TMB]
MRASEEEMKRIKDRERGKARAADKIKQERNFTPMPDADDSKHTKSSHKHRPGSTPSGIPPGSSRSSMDPRRSLIRVWLLSALDEIKKKKKKRKHEEMSDVETEHRKRSPPPVQVSSGSHHSKQPKPSGSIGHPHPPKPLAGQDFTIPAPSSLVPARPPIQPAPVPGPSKTTDVMEDFSKAKQPSQILVSTFYTSIEPWLRSIKEEDVGFLEYTADEVEPYVMPTLGRHYSEVWEEEDIALYGGPLPGFSATRFAGHANASIAPAPKWDPSTLTEPDLLGEARGHGPLTERLVSALLPMPDVTVWKGVKAAEDAMEGRPGGSGAAAAKREKVNVALLEDRIRETMRFHGLLENTPDFSEKVDDPIATALRQAQGDLRKVVATNKARKERLASIARDRLGYQEYLDLRESIDKNISNMYAKLQKKDVPKLAKKKKIKGVEVNGNASLSSGSASTSALPPPHPAALGLNPDDDHTLVISEQLRQLVETRRKWVDTVGGIFDEKQEECPGRIWGTPQQSVFLGVDEEVRQAFERSKLAEAALAKGKAKVTGDEMDVG